MSGSIGPLLPADENFNRQVVDTFASVAHSDPGWAEKVCGMAAAKDGSLQIGFGFGKYTNRNVVDAYAGVSCGQEQWVSTRDQSWGIRSQVGGPPTAMQPDFHRLIPQALAIWNPILF